MTILKVEKRDMNVKAKALRRQGQIPGNVYGRDIDEAISIQLPAIEAKRFLKDHAKGSQIILDLDGQKMSALVRDITYNSMTRQYYHVDFQALIAGEKVTSTAPVLLLNSEEVIGYLTYNLTEISYKAIPSALIEKVEIDVSQLKTGTTLFVKDLEIAQNPNIELITPADTLVLHIAEHSKYTADKKAEEEVENEAEEA